MIRQLALAALAGLVLLAATGGTGATLARAHTDASSTVQLTSADQLTWIRVRANGTVDPAQSSPGVTSSMVQRKGGLVCLYLPYKPVHVQGVLGDGNGRPGLGLSATLADHPGCTGTESAAVVSAGPWFFDAPRAELKSAAYHGGAYTLLLVKPPGAGGSASDPPQDAASFAFARVLASGSVDGARSSGISSGMIHVAAKSQPLYGGAPFPGAVYCVTLPFTPAFATAIPEHPTAGAITQIELGVDRADCPGSESVRIEFRRRILFGTSSAPSYLLRSAFYLLAVKNLGQELDTVHVLASGSLGTRFTTGFTSGDVAAVTNQSAGGNWGLKCIRTDTRPRFVLAVPNHRGESLSATAPSVDVSLTVTATNDVEACPSSKHIGIRVGTYYLGDENDLISFPTPPLSLPVQQVPRVQGYFPTNSAVHVLVMR